MRAAKDGWRGGREAAGPVAGEAGDRFGEAAGHWASPHPSKRIIGSEAATLAGKTVVLALTGSVAAVKSFELCRALMRRGATVKVAMSRAACDIIGEQAMHFASGEPVVTRLSGDVEHVRLLDRGGEADALVVAPATANCIGKIANGIADDVISTLALTALGSGKPVVVVPAMEEGMWLQPFVAENVLKLKSVGVEVVEPRREEGKAKAAETGDIVLRVERLLMPKPLAGRKVVVTAGATRESIDDVRVITNRSSGLTGREIALQAYRLGALVAVVHGAGGWRPGLLERDIRCMVVEGVEEMAAAVLREVSDADWFVAAAAAGDFSVEKAVGKLASGEEHALALRPAKKILGEVKRLFPGVKCVGFKAEAGVSRAELVERARTLLAGGCALVAANDVAGGGMGGLENALVLLTSSGEEWVSGKKARLAERLWEKALGAGEAGWQRG